MPDPILYGKAMAAAAGASAIVVLVLGRFRPPAGAARLNAASLLGIGLGLLVGCIVLSIDPGWPPASALPRLLTIVLPAAVGIELLCGLERVPAWLGWLLRIGLSAAIGRVLLHGSVYLSGRGGELTILQAWIAMAIGSALLVIVWSTLCWVSMRPAAASIPLVLAEVTLCAGFAIMLAGYLKGGEATFPPFATLVATTTAMRLGTPRPALRGAIGIGVVLLFGFLFIGRFFGGLSTSTALIVFLSPLLCCVTEFPLFRLRNPWLVGVLRIALVAIPLVVVLVQAKRAFDRNMGPLVTSATYPL
jgi:hypothetical protein